MEMVKSVCPYSSVMSAKVIVLMTATVLLAVGAAGAMWWFLDNRQDQTPSWLFSHTSDSGSLQDNDDGTFTLTLNDIDPHTIAFTDRPDRDSEIIDTAALVEAWPTMFADSAPNAVLVEHQPTGEANSVVLTLENPQLSGSTLTFDALVLAEEVPSSVENHAGPIHLTPPATFEAASLFIDDVFCRRFQGDNSYAGDFEVGGCTVTPFHSSSDAIQR